MQQYGIGKRVPQVIRHLHNMRIGAGEAELSTY